MLKQYVEINRYDQDFSKLISQSPYSDVIMSPMASQITSLKIDYSSVYSGADQRKHQTSALLAFVRGIHRWPLNSMHKGPVTWKIFPFDDTIMISMKQNNDIMIPSWYHHDINETECLIYFFAFLGTRQNQTGVTLLILTDCIYM